jgi:hypothetical protein
MTAALEGNKASAEALAKKGNLLSGEQALAAMSKANLSHQLNIIASANLSQSINVETKLASAISQQALENICSVIRSAAQATMQNKAAEGALQNNTQAVNLFNNAFQSAIKNSNVSAGSLSSRVFANLSNAAKEALAKVAKAEMANKASTTLASKQNSEKLGMSKGVAIDLSTIQFNGAGNVFSSFNSMNVFNSQVTTDKSVFCNQVSQMINQTAAAGNAQLNNRPPIKDK